VSVERVTFAGHEAVRLVAHGQTLAITTDVGPRILGFAGAGENLLAVLPDDAIEHPGIPPFRFVGGHRLWAAPEVPVSTYEPDDAPCAVEEVGDGVRVVGAVGGVTGLVRSIAVRPVADGWRVTHGIRNAGSSVAEVAPWAITQVRLGGEAFLPLPSVGEPPQADRALVLWPYTDLTDGRYRLADGGVWVSGVAGAATKVGAAPGAGWLAYRIDGEELRIAADVPRGAVPDRGAAAQVFTCERFLELETLGALAHLAPGDTVEHVETWTLGAVA
jgi:hypothetical protein